MNLGGIFVGLIVFLLIGLLHVVIIKGVYYFSTKIWPVFLIIGLALLGWSLVLADLWSSLAGVLGFTSLWCVKEVFDQKKRIEKGWFPKNPKYMKK